MFYIFNKYEFHVNVTNEYKNVFCNTVFQNIEK